MNWIDTRDRLPSDDDIMYVISVTRGNYTFKAVAFFSLDSLEWFYSNKGERDELVTDRVNAWLENLAIYIR